MAHCVNENDLASYIDGVLIGNKDRLLKKHINRCTRCKEIVKITRLSIKNESEIRFDLDL